MEELGVEKLDDGTMLIPVVIKVPINVDVSSGGWEVEAVDLPGCKVHADSTVDVVDKATKAAALWIEAAVELARIDMSRRECPGIVLLKPIIPVVRSVLDSDPNLFPLQILKVQLNNNESCRWANGSNGWVDKEGFAEKMNKHHDKEADALRRAIDILSGIKPQAI